MRAGRTTSVAVAIACAVALAITGHAGAAPLDDADPLDDPGSSTVSDLDEDTGPASADEDTGPAADDDTGPASTDGDPDGAATEQAARGIDLDHPVTDKQLRYVTDFLVFRASMADFQHVRRQRLLSSQVTWDTGACGTPLRDSVSGFGSACERREFGYRNFERQGRFDGGMRERVDKRFKRELRAECSGQDLVGRTACERKADLYFATVN
jgi:hypothetical protein